MKDQIEHHFKVYVNPEVFYSDQIKQIKKTSQSEIDPKSAISKKAKFGEGSVFVFYFGAVAFWNVPEEHQMKELEYLFPSLKQGSIPLTEEGFKVIEGSDVEEKVSFNHLSLKALTKDRAEVIASVIAQSATMEYYELMTRETWAAVDALLRKLKKSGTISPFPGKMHRKIAESILTRSKVVRVLHLLDRPDLIWSDPVMDSLYNDLRASFDLPERFQALEYKLSLIQDTLGLLLDTSRDRRAYWLEAAIVVMIFFDIMVMIFEKWL